MLLPTPGFHCLAFQKVLREGFAGPNEVPRLQFPSFCWLFISLLALTQKTQGANTIPVFTFSFALSFQNWKMWMAKITQSCLVATEFIRSSDLCVHLQACMCLYGDFQKPQYSSYKLSAEFHLRAGNLFPSSSF